MEETLPDKAHKSEMFFCCRRHFGFKCRWNFTQRMCVRQMVAYLSNKTSKSRPIPVINPCQMCWKKIDHSPKVNHSEHFIYL